ncbi:MAG: PD40 domain-containing protein [Candidatus Aminicenantes bacterium]|nr:PD40 domain-containing protein [Candidatus Aminicenantes bacterium]
MKLRFFTVTILTIIFALALVGGNQQNAKQLYQSGLYKEEVEGDLQKAIELYQKILKQFPKNREIGAKALYRVGFCYEKLGKQEAQKAYQRIIREYADQREVVKDARKRLASLVSVSKDTGPVTPAVKSAGITIKKIDIDEIEKTHQARLSPDGTKMLYIHVQEKKPRQSIRVMDLTSGKSLALVEGISYGNSLIFEWSPDGKKVVYRNHKKNGLSVIDSGGGTPEVLWSSPDKNTVIFPLDWSFDNRHILAAIINQAEATVRLVTLPSNGGVLHTVVSGGLNEIEDFAGFSPNGKYIVGFKMKESNTDIYIWPVEGGKEIQVTSHPAKDQSPFWSPDGEYIVFVSDRAKTNDLWAIPMDGPNPAGTPIRIKRNLGKNAIPMDLTPGGKLALLILASGEAPPDLFVLPVDPSKGEALGQFHSFAKYPTQHFMPRWSPDGLRVAYTSRKENIQLPEIFVSSGDEKEDLKIPVGNYYVGNVEWSRDGKHLIFPGLLSRDGGVGIFRVSLESHKIEPLHLEKRSGRSLKGMFINLRWLPRAGKFIFDKFVEVNKRELYTMNKEGKNIQLVADKVTTRYWTWPSPDGRYVAYREGQNLKLLFFADNTSITLARFPEGEHIEGLAWSPDGQNVAWNDNRQLTVFSIAKRVSRILVEANKNQKISGMGWSWSPNHTWSLDGKKIAFVLQETSAGSEAQAGLWIISATGGTPKKIADAPSSHPVINDVVWHSKGKMIFVTGYSGKERIGYEHWVMENFLPEKKSKKK